MKINVTFSVEADNFVNFISVLKKKNLEPNAEIENFMRNTFLRECLQSDKICKIK